MTTPAALSPGQIDVVVSYLLAQTDDSLPLPGEVNAASPPPKAVPPPKHSRCHCSIHPSIQLFQILLIHDGVFTDTVFTIQTIG
ncbi:MAG: hypothetical protein M5U34_17335 [Chloroflexi bacterium]|nr:hypothetical protein [Chloroflexota bacterium]